MAVLLYSTNTINGRPVAVFASSQVVTTDGSGNATVNYGITYAENAFCVVAFNGDRNTGLSFYCEILNGGSKGTSSAVVRSTLSNGAAVLGTIRIDIISFGALA